LHRREMPEELQLEGEVVGPLVRLRARLEAEGAVEAAEIREILRLHEDVRLAVLGFVRRAVLRDRVREDAEVLRADLGRAPPRLDGRQAFRARELRKAPEGGARVDGVEP